MNRTIGAARETQATDRWPLQSSYQDSVAVFPSALGWMAVAWHRDRLVANTFGWTEPDRAFQSLQEWRQRDQREADVADDADEKPLLATVSALLRFADGQPESLGSIPLDWTGYTDFQRTVLQRCREIPYGDTRSYGELAAEAGRPRAARAVGTTMRKNRYPLIVPCHRVLAAGGKTGGYSAPEGISMKQRLLQLERDALAGDCT